MDSPDADFVRAFDAKWNAHDEAAILAIFDDGAVIQLSPAPPSPMQPVYQGRDEIAQFVGVLLPGFHVESRGQVLDGGAVTWTFAVGCDAFRQLGLEVATGSATARLLGNQIRAFNIAFDETTVGSLAAAATHAGY